MPCTFCNRVYRKIPCIMDGRYDGNPILKERWYSYYSPPAVRKIVSTALLLHGSCPCEECLVKIMCIKLCEEYRYRVINPIEGVT